VQNIQNVDDRHITMNILENEETEGAEQEKEADSYKMNLMAVMDNRCMEQLKDQVKCILTLQRSQSFVTAICSQ